MCILQVLVQQKEEEKRRMKELDLLFAEETEHFWERQDRIWKDERRARNKLMEDVIAGWKEQCEEKITGKILRCFTYSVFVPWHMPLSVIHDQKDHE